PNPDLVNHTANLNVTATGGSFTLSYGGATTAAIPVGSPGWFVQQALDALPAPIGGNNWSGAYHCNNGRYTIMFQNHLGNQAQSIGSAPGLVVNTGGLTGGTASLSSVKAGNAGVSGATVHFGGNGISFPNPARGDDFIGDYQGQFYAPVSGYYGFDA